MITKRTISLTLILVLSIFLAGCVLSTTVDTTSGATSSTTTSNTQTSDGFLATFVLDDNVTVTAYPTQELEDGEITTTAYAKDSDSGEILTDGEGQVNFVVTLAEGYEVATILVSPDDNYNNLKGPGETGIANTYRITKMTGNITVSITTRTIIDTSDYDNTSPTTIVLSDSGTTITNNNGGVSESSGTLTITEAGIYEISGSLSEGSVLVAASDDDDVYLVLDDLSITSTSTAPINIYNADKADITILEGATVTLTDSRPSSMEETDDTPVAALYATCDLAISGTGTLNINGNYQNGITSKDDLEISEATISVISADNGIKGSDSLTITSGTISIIAQGGDGLKTTNSELTDSSKQKGTLTISGGTITINAACDGIDSAYDVVIENDPVITINTTETYASGVSGAITPSTDTLYLRVSSRLYDSNYRFAIYYSNPETSIGTFVDATYLKTGIVDGRTYYYYTFDLESGYTHYILYRFLNSSSDSLTTYNAKSETSSINTAYDMLVVSSTGITGSVITTSWLSYDNQSTWTSTDSVSYSAKGIKADNEIVISGGTITIRSYDDSIHANSDTELENGSYGLGNITINGGTLTLTSKDDGIHADTTITISGGIVTVLTSYEGIEGNVIRINGGTTTIFSTDDGINATYGAYTPSITVTGGYVDITVGTGDTDAIDSNGTYTQTGGFVVSRSALSGGQGGALDTAGTVSITGGTFIGIGVSERVATSSGDNRSTGIMSVTIYGGTYTVEDSIGNVIMTFTTSGTYTYHYIWISSNLLTKGTTYNIIRDTTNVKTWTQS